MLIFRGLPCAATIFFQQAMELPLSSVKMVAEKILVQDNRFMASLFDRLFSPFDACGCILFHQQKIGHGKRRIECYKERKRDHQLGAADHRCG